MPSTTSSSVATLLASSTVITPSFPTFSMALAIISPISRSPLAETEPTWATSAEVLIFLVLFCSSSMTTATALSMPRFRSIGFIPAATDFTPSRTIALATVTPSLVIRGAPKLLSSTTLRPFGPSVTFTASARTSTPRIIRSRAFAPNLTSFAAISDFLLVVVFGGLDLGGPLRRGDTFKDAHDVGLLHDQELLTIKLHLGARPLAEQDAV